MRIAVYSYNANATFLTASVRMQYLAIKYLAIIGACQVPRAGARRTREGL